MIRLSITSSAFGRAHSLQRFKTGALGNQNNDDRPMHPVSILFSQHGAVMSNDRVSKQGDKDTPKKTG